MTLIECTGIPDDLHHFSSHSFFTHKHASTFANSCRVGLLRSTIQSAFCLVMATAGKTIKKANARLMNLHDRAQLLLAFGRRLEQLRLQKGLTPSQFDAKSGIDAGNLAKYEQGNREPGLVVIFIMARALDVRASELLNFEVSDTESKAIDGKHPKDPIELLRSLMKEKNMKSKDLVELLGVSKGHVSGILHYKKGLSKQNIKILADYFKIDIALLFGKT